MILSISVWNTSTHKDIKLNVKGEFVPNIKVKWMWTKCRNRKHVSRGE